MEKCKICGRDIAEEEVAEKEYRFLMAAIVHPKDVGKQLKEYPARQHTICMDCTYKICK